MPLNLLTATTIYGRTNVANVTTVATTFVANPVSSNVSYKINTIMLSNVDGSFSANVTMDILRSTIPYNIAKTVIVPAKSTLEVISKTLYLEEGDTIRLYSSANNQVQAVCSYEEFR